MHIIDMIATVRQYAHELNENFVTDYHIVNFINRAQREAQKRLVKRYEENFHTSASYDIVASTESYAIPSDCIENRIQSIEIHHNNQIYYPARLPLTKRERVNSLADTSTIPDYYIINGNYIDLFPIPSTSISSGLKIYYTQRIPKVGVPQGQVESIPDESSFVLEDVGEDLAAGEYISLCESQFGAIRGTYRIASIESSTSTITISTGASVAISGSSSTSNYFSYSSGTVDDIKNCDRFTITGGVAINGSYTVKYVDSANSRLYVYEDVDATETFAESITVYPRLTYKGRTVSYSLSSSIYVEDIITLAPEVGSSHFLEDYEDYVLQYAIVNTLKKAKEPCEEEYRELKEMEEQLITTWQNRLSRPQITLYGIDSYYDYSWYLKRQMANS